MKKYINYIAVALLAAFSLSSCKSLDVAPPNNITDEQIQKILEEGDESAKNLIINLVGTGLENFFNISGQTWTGYSSYPLNSQIDQDYLMSLRGNDVIPGTAVTASSGHETAYELIKTFNLTDNTYPYYALSASMLTGANKALLYLTPEAAKAGANARKYRGQALAVRAYAYMQLMERFQPAYTNGGKDGKGMPIYKSYGTNDPAPISSATDTYKFILEDLTEAVEDLAEMGYTTEPKDVDRGVAQFLLARAALWSGDWDTCIKAASEIVSKFPNFIKEANYGAKDADFKAYCDGTKDCKSEDNAFLVVAANPEALMGFISGAGSNTYTSSFFNIFANGVAGSSGEPPRIDSRLYDKIDANDFRKDIFTTSTANYKYILDSDGKTLEQQIPEYSSMKFAATFAKGVTVRDHQIICDNYIFRSSEAYLMLAEAYAQSGQDAKAKEVLNKLLAARTRAGKPTLTCDNYSGMSGMSALQMVQLQTRIEMWCEGGREFYNNKRWNISVNRTGSNNHYRTGTLSVDEMVLSIPRSETTTNTHWAD